MINCCLVEPWGLPTVKQKVWGRASSCPQIISILLEKLLCCHSVVISRWTAILCNSGNILVINFLIRNLWKTEFGKKKTNLRNCIVDKGLVCQRQSLNLLFDRLHKCQIKATEMVLVSRKLGKTYQHFLYTAHIVDDIVVWRLMKHEQRGGTTWQIWLNCPASVIKRKGFDPRRRLGSIASKLFPRIDGAAPAKLT